MEHQHEEHEAPPSFWSTRYAIGLLVIGGGACPEFCVNGADIKYRRCDLRTRW